MTKGLANDILVTTMMELATRLRQFSNIGYRGVTVAVSGGCDSQALLAMLDDAVRPCASFRLFVMHFNFRLRASSSDIDAQLVATTAESRRLPFYLHTVGDKERASRGNTQEWARDLRQRQLSAHAKRFVHVIALAHHLDDLAENAVYRLTKGVSPEHLLGMKEFNPPFWRPLLPIPKQQLEDFCRRCRVFYRTDRSNDDNTYARNRIRNTVMPTLSTINCQTANQLVTTFSEIAQLYRQTRIELQKAYAEHLARQCLPIDILQKLPPSKVRIIVHLLLPTVSRRLLERIITEAMAEQVFSYQSSARVTVASDGKILRWFSKDSTAKVSRRQQYRRIVHNCRHIAVLEAHATADIGDGLRLRNDGLRQRLCNLSRPLAKERVCWQGKNRLFKEVIDKMQIPFSDSLFFYVQVDDDKSCPTLLKISRPITGD